MPDDAQARAGFDRLAAHALRPYSCLHRCGGDCEILLCNPKEPCEDPCARSVLPQARQHHAAAAPSSSASTFWPLATQDGQCRQLASSGDRLGTRVSGGRHHFPPTARYPSLVHCSGTLWLVSTVHGVGPRVDVRALNWTDRDSALRLSRAHSTSTGRQKWPLHDGNMAGNAGAACAADGRTLILIGGVGVGGEARDDHGGRGVGLQRATAELAAEGMSSSSAAAAAISPSAAAISLSSSAAAGDAVWRWAPRGEVVNTGDAHATGCTEKRGDGGMRGCEFDGKVSLVRAGHGSVLYMYARANLERRGGGRHVQVARSDDDGLHWSRWQLLDLAGYRTSPANNIYYFNVQEAPWWADVRPYLGSGGGDDEGSLLRNDAERLRAGSSEGLSRTTSFPPHGRGGNRGGNRGSSKGGVPPPRLLAFFPAVIDGVGGVYASVARPDRGGGEGAAAAHWSGVHWTRPTLLLASPTLDRRTPDHPIGIVALPPEREAGGAAGGVAAMAGGGHADDRAAAAAHGKASGVQTGRREPVRSHRGDDGLIMGTTRRAVGGATTRSQPLTAAAGFSRPRRRLALLVLHNVDILEGPGEPDVNGTYRNGAIRCGCETAKTVPRPFVCSYAL